MRIKLIGALSSCLLVAVFLAVPHRARIRKDPRRPTSCSSCRHRWPATPVGSTVMQPRNRRRGRRSTSTSPDARKYTGYLNAKHDGALAKVGGGNKIYDYTTVFNGFAAQLTDAQAKTLQAVDGVLTVEKAEMLSVDTSSTPSFLGLDQPGGLWDKLGGVNKGGLGSGAGEDVVIGDVDGGYWPENPAFSDRKVNVANREPLSPQGDGVQRCLRGG